MGTVDEGKTEAWRGRIAAGGKGSGALMNKRKGMIKPI
jgi:hypothetical protein